MVDPLICLCRRKRMLTRRKNTHSAFKPEFKVGAHLRLHEIKFPDLQIFRFQGSMNLSKLTISE